MSKPSSLQRARRSWVVFVVVVLLILVAVILGAAQRAQKMSSEAPSSSAQQFSQTAPSTKTKIIVEIEKQDADGNIAAKLLNAQGEQVYTRTTTPVTIHADGKTRYVMGKASDVRQAAIVHVTGTVDPDHRVQAEQIVILTGYVQVH